MDTYTHIGLYDERAAIDSLPKLPSLDGNENNQNKVVGSKTGTDNLPVKCDESAYKPAYKKLAKNAFFGCDKPSLIDTKKNENQESLESSKSLGAVVLGSESNRLSTRDTGKNERRRPDSNRRITVLQTVALDHLATPPV